jgi:hypothetical protein
MHWAWICFTLTFFFALNFSSLYPTTLLLLAATSFFYKSLAGETRKGYLFTWRVLLIELGVLYSLESVDRERNIQKFY